MTILETTTRRLFAEMESAGIPYAVLRNYEFLFSLQKENSSSISDIDLVMDAGKLDAFRQIVANLAIDTGWDAAIECDHWAQSPMLDHRIEVFRLYSRDPLVCVEIDVFHSFLTHGVPLFDEQQLLQGRERDPHSGVLRIDPHQENAIRLIQIAGLADAPRKRERYCRRLLAHLRDHEDAFVKTLSPRMDGFIGRAVEALLSNDLASVERWMSRGRAWFFARYATHHPARTAKLLLHRFADQAKRFYTNQCGSIGRFHAPDKALRAMIRSVLDEMVAGNFINDWAEIDSDRIGIRTRKRMEQTSVIIRWTGADGCDLNFDACKTREDVLSLLFAFSVSRHQSLIPAPTGACIVERT